MPEEPSPPPVRCLIFASGRVGRELVGYLLGGGCFVRHIVVGREDDQAILEMATAAGVPNEVFTEATCRRLADDGDGCDWLLNLWSPHILPASVLGLARRRLNVHPGIVPDCRGNDPAAWAIRKGLPTGVSLIEMNADVDTGGIYAERRFAPAFPVRGRDLHDKLQDEAIRLFVEEWPRLAASAPEPRPQIGPGNRHRRRMTESDRILDGATVMTLKEFVTWTLAHDFAPGTTAEAVIDGKRFKLTLRIEESVGPARPIAVKPSRNAGSSSGRNRLAAGVRRSNR